MRLHVRVRRWEESPAERADRGSTTASAATGFHFRDGTWPSGHNSSTSDGSSQYAGNEIHSPSQSAHEPPGSCH